MSVKCSKRATLVYTQIYLHIQNREWERERELWKRSIELLLLLLRHQGRILNICVTQAHSILEEKVFTNSCCWRHQPTNFADNNKRLLFECVCMWGYRKRTRGRWGRRVKRMSAIKGSLSSSSSSTGKGILYNDRETANNEPLAQMKISKSHQRIFKRRKCQPILGLLFNSRAILAETIKLLKTIRTSFFQSVATAVG